jgi:RNA polymerase-binding transcription factor DksA
LTHVTDKGIAMNKDRLDRYRQQLRTLLAGVETTAAGLEDQVRTALGGEAGGGLSNAPMHLGDLGSETYAQELGATLLENEIHIRDETVAALERIDRGTYGVCESCRQPVRAERLDALPYTRYCTACAAKLQDGAAVNLNTGRPEGWLGAPGHEGKSVTGSPDRAAGRNLGGAPDDVHAAGTPGGGTAVGGLAGTNVGGGAPDTANLEAAMGSGAADAPIDTDDEDEPEALSGASGGAVGGTPANKRSGGGVKSDDPTPEPKKKGDPKRPRK